MGSLFLLCFTFFCLCTVGLSIAQQIHGLAYLENAVLKLLGASAVGKMIHLKDDILIVGKIELVLGLSSFMGLYNVWEKHKPQKADDCSSKGLRGTESHSKYSKDMGCCRRL